MWTIKFSGGVMFGMVFAVCTLDAAKSGGKDERLAFMRLAGSSSLIPVMVPDFDTAEDQVSYNYKQPKKGYNYPKPTTEQPRTTTKPIESPISEYSDEMEEEIDGAGSIPTVQPQRKAEFPKESGAIGSERERDIDSLGISPDPLPPGVYDTPQYERSCGISVLNCIPGTAGVDYPNYSQLPQTNFRCPTLSGYYGDTQTSCQAFHVCLKTRENVKQYSFLCPNGTIFSQNEFICVWWNEFNCEDSPGFYHLNKQLHWDDESVGLKQKIGYLKNMIRTPGIDQINPINFPQQLIPALTIRLPDSRQTYGFLQQTLSSGWKNDAGGFIVNNRQQLIPYYPPYEYNDTPTTVFLGSNEEEEDIQPGRSYPQHPPILYQKHIPRPSRPHIQYPSYDEQQENIQPGGSYPTHIPPLYRKPTRRPLRPSIPFPQSNKQEESIQPGGSLPTPVSPQYPYPKARPKYTTTKYKPTVRPQVTMRENEQEAIQPAILRQFPKTTTTLRPRVRITTRKFTSTTTTTTEPSTTFGFHVPGEGYLEVMNTTLRPRTSKPQLNYLPPKAPMPPAITLPPVITPPLVQVQYSGYSEPRLPSYESSSSNYGSPPPPQSGYNEQYTIPFSSQNQIYYQKSNSVPQSGYDGVAIFLPRDVIPAPSPVVALQKEYLQNGVIPAVGPIEPIRAVSYSFPPAPVSIPISIGQQQHLVRSQDQYQRQLFTDPNFEPYEVLRSQRQSSNNEKSKVQSRLNKEKGRVEGKHSQQPITKSQPARKPNVVVNRRRESESDSVSAMSSDARSKASLVGPVIGPSIIEPPERSVELQSRQLNTVQEIRGEKPGFEPTPPPVSVKVERILNRNELFELGESVAEVLPVSLVYPLSSPPLLPLSYDPFHEPSFAKGGGIPREVRHFLIPDVVDPPQLIRATEVFAKTYIDQDQVLNSPTKYPPIKLLHLPRDHPPKHFPRDHLPKHLPPVHAPKDQRRPPQPRRKTQVKKQRLFLDLTKY